MTAVSKETRRAFVYVGLAYLTFVVYGSLVPLDLRDVGWSEAWQRFRTIPYLDLGIASRADWIANALLYIPLTFVWSGVVDRSDRRSARLFTAFFILAAAIALAIAVEFAQVFFPPRTVSLNDLLAEALGSIAGVLLWVIAGARFTGWLAALSKGGRAAKSAALSLYLLAYVGLSLFPFDFVVSVHEFASKLANGYDSVLLTTAGTGKGRMLAQLLLEVVAAVPVGMMVALLLKSAQGSKLGAAMLAGAMLGGVIELVQLFMYSGTAQGASVLTRMAGAALGAMVYAWFPAQRALRMVDACFKFRSLALLVVPVYLAGLAVMQHWRFGGWIDWGSAIDRLHEIRFLPFYYHYFTSETLALRSLLAMSVAYAPVGFIWFLVTRAGGRHGMATSAGLAALLAAVFEFAKLFQPHLRPDPTNVLIAATAAAAIYLLMRWIRQLSMLQVTDDAGAPTPLIEATPEADRPDAGGRAPFGLLAVSCVGVLVWAIVRYPLGGFWLATGLLAYGAVLRRWPQGWLVIVPAALPVLDLANWTGRFFFDEFDCLVLATVAASAWWRSGRPLSYRVPPTALLVLALFSVSTLVSLMIGAYPFPAPDLNSFNNYYSPYNALRVGKGLLWALLLLPLMKGELERNLVGAHRLFAFGMTSGAFAAGIAVLWERIAFTGPFNFDSIYRVVGMFSGMHTGGAYIEGYLVTAMPFVVWWTLTSHRWIGRLFGAGVFVLGGYAVMVTYARGGYIALALGLAVLMASLLLAGRKASLKPWHAVGGTVLLVLLIGVAWPVMHGRFMPDRFSATERDMHIRTGHWEDGLRMMDENLTTTLFGMGLGRYPQTYFWRNFDEVRPAAFGFRAESGNTYLTLTGGDTLYLEQLINTVPGQRYRLSFTARSGTKATELALPVCEKWMLYSAACAWQTVRIGDTQGEWRRFSLEFDTRNFRPYPFYLGRPIKLSLFNPVAGSMLDVDEISIITQQGSELLRNGEFSDGLDHWFFSTENHLAWHLKNLWLHVYFEQGAVGLLLFAWLVACACIAFINRYREKDLCVPALGAALVAFLTVGAVDSLLDVPRVSLMFYLLVAMLLLQQHCHRKDRGDPRNSESHSRVTERKRVRQSPISAKHPSPTS